MAYVTKDDGAIDLAVSHHHCHQTSIVKTDEGDMEKLRAIVPWRIKGRIYSFTKCQIRHFNSQVTIYMIQYKGLNI